MEEDKILPIFTRRIYPEVDLLPHRQLIERMRTAILGDDPVDPLMAVIVSLADAANILRHLFDRKDRKDARKRIKNITSGNVEGQAAQEAITAMRAAIATPAVMPAIIAAT